MPIETSFNQPAEWLKQQARHVLWECDEYGVEPRFFLHDNDTGWFCCHLIKLLSAHPS